MENAIRAGATVIEVAVEEEPERDLLSVAVEDNGPGLPVAADIAADPFFTTKEGKKTGLGLGMLKFRAEQAGGSFRLEKSCLGGLAVRATMPLSSVDRSPLGDLAATVASVVCTNPEVELRSRLRVAQGVVGEHGGHRACAARGRAERDRRGASDEGTNRGGPRGPSRVGLIKDGREKDMEGKEGVGAVPAAASCACGDKSATEAQLMERLDEVLTEYQGKPGALIPVLQIAQGIFGYLPQSALKRVALRLGKSYSEVAGVVGFYSFFSTVPRGKHLVRVCLGTACYVRGGKQVLESCRQELGIDVGGTTADGLFTLEVARCFGACGLAPTMMIDEDVHQRVKPQKLRALFADYRDGAPTATNGKKQAAAKKPSKKAGKPTVARAGAGRKERVVAR